MHCLELKQLFFFFGQEQKQLCFMDLSVFIACILMFLRLLGGYQVGLAQGSGFDMNYIRWEDMKVDPKQNPRFYSREERTSSLVIVVDKTGGGDSLTVQGAVDMVPEHNTKRVKILILPGIYREKVIVPSTKPYVSFIGTENRASETVISWNDKASDKDSHGIELGTYRSASVTIEADFFCANGITFENTVVAVPGGYGMQAVALRVAGDKAMFYRVRVLGTQDTLLDEKGSHYYFLCHIQGSIDFIFGRSRSLFQECVLHSIATRSGAIAAHHRDVPNDDTGFSFLNCSITGTGNIYLGRAWGDYSRAVYSYCYIDNIINPAGWSDWNHTNRQKTAVFGEYQCHGRGADMRGRVSWSKTFSYVEARPFLDLRFIDGDQWLRI